MKVRLMILALLVALMGLLVAPATAGAAKQPSGPVPIPVTGSGAFTGQFNLKRFVATNGGQGIAVVGDLLGADGTMVQANVVWPIDLAATGIANQTAPASGAAVPAATCDILHLVLGPLHLDLLGLVIDLNRVVLDITAVTGSGKLLGNLLCGILGILDPLVMLQQLLAILGQLNTLLDQLNGFLGNLSGVLSIVGGNMLVNSFTRTGDQIFANGTLAGQAVSVPLDLAATRAANAAGTCDILKLVLGPLHLDLLGLNIDLSRVVLTIVAERGPGNLLGNLLCAIVHLLDGPSPLSALLNQLNHILRVLGGA